MKEINNRVIQIGVIGGGLKNLPKNRRLRNRLLLEAEDVGRKLAESGAILISGGMDGIMEASCKGAYEAGGVVISTPGRERGLSNPYITAEVCTPIDVGDYLFAGILSSDVLIVFPGGAGTLAEVALAYRYSKPMIIMSGYDAYYDNLIGEYLDYSNKIRFLGADSSKEAVTLAIKKASC